MRVVIVGNGVAGIEAALGVRRARPDWPIAIVSEESDHFFSRTALMWVACGQLSHRDIEPYERDLYVRERFERVRARATAIDVEKQLLRLGGDGGTRAWDRLLVACGSRPRAAPWPGADLRGVGHLVTLQDLEWLERELHGGPSRGGRPPRPDAHLSTSDARSPYRTRDAAADVRGRAAKRVVVIGGGLIGIEAVEVAHAAGAHVTFLIREEHYWPVALERAEATLIAERMRAHGIDARLGESVEAIEGDAAGLVSRVRTDRGVYDADAVVVAIGVVPATEWLEGSAIELDSATRGVVVDERLRTSADGVMAAGDCAAVHWHDGSRRPEQLWYTARDQGRIAARALLGEATPYARGTFYNSSKLVDVEHTTVGRVGEDAKGSRSWLYEERGAVRSTTRIMVDGERVVGMTMLGRRWDHSVLVRFVEEERSLAYVLDHLAEASFDGELVPRLVVPEAARRAEPA